MEVDRGYYYNENLETFKNGYIVVHGYLAFTLCVFGIAANIASIVVFTRRNMISPTHAILTALAVADILVMLSYMIFAFNAYIRGELQKYVLLSYGRTVFDLVNFNFGLVACTVSNWMTVAVAVFHVIAVRCPVGAATWCSMSRAKCAIAATFLTVVVCSIPIYITFTVKPTQEEGGYLMGLREIVEGNKFLLLRIISHYHCVQGLMSCVVLTVLSCLLVRYRLLQQNVEDNTNRNLLAVCLLTMFSQFPIFLVDLLARILGLDFEVHVKEPLLNLLETVALIDKGFKFVIYCLMSRQFRKTFMTLFPFVKARRSETNSESAETIASTAI